jgi:hypothetical protein
MAEERSFAYFCTNTSMQFAAPFGNEFWTCLVLQIGERERSVKQATVALGALHESFKDEHLTLHLSPSQLEGKSHKPNWTLTNLATSSYAKALRELNENILPNTWDGLHVSLLCCILFTSFEWLRGSYAAAIIHLKSGLNILRQWTSMATSPNTPTAHIIRRHLAPMFVRLSIQARTFSQDVTPMPWLSTGLLGFTDYNEAQNKEQHLRAARIALDAVCGEVYLQPSNLTLISTNFTLSPPTAYEFSLRLAKWCAEYHTHLLPIIPIPLDEEAPRPENINLTLWYTMLSVLQATSMTDDPMQLDEYTPQFTRVVQLAKMLVQPHTDTQDTPRFRVDMETVPMLYHVASKCRHPSLRREAIALLRSSANREGLWDGWAVARLAEEIMEMEEEGLGRVEMREAEDVPAQQRVCKLEEVTDLQSRTMRVRFMRWEEEEFGEWRVLAW